MNKWFLIIFFKNLIKIKWFPRSFIREERTKINEFIQALCGSKLDKKALIKEYIEKREDMIEIQNMMSSTRLVSKITLKKKALVNILH